MILPKIKDDRKERRQQDAHHYQGSTFASILEKAAGEHLADTDSYEKSDSICCITNTYGIDLKHHSYHYQSREYSY